MPTILIIEDDAAVHDMLTRALTGCGYATCSATDGLTGITQLRTQTPDLVISDLELPYLSGPEVIAQGAPPFVPVIFISGTDCTAVTLGDRTYPVLAKPFDLFLLLEDIAALLQPPVPPHMRGDRGRNHPS